MTWGSPRASLYVKYVGYSDGCVPPACVDSHSPMPRSKTGIVSHLPCYATFPRRRECRQSRKAPTSRSAAETGVQPQMPSEHSLNTLSACTLAPPFFIFFYFLFFIFYFLFSSSITWIIFPFFLPLYKCTPPPLPSPCAYSSPVFGALKCR